MLEISLEVVVPVMLAIGSSGYIIGNRFGQNGLKTGQKVIETNITEMNKKLDDLPCTKHDRDIVKLKVKAGID